MSEQIHALQGRQCLAVTFDEATEQWIFDFEHKAMLTVASPWRIIVGGRIRLGWRDHGQPFGLPSPVNGVSEATKFLGGVEVKSASVAAETSDLVISFVSGCRLEVFNGSSGYEGWTLNAPGGERFVAQGGGDLVRFERGMSNFRVNPPGRPSAPGTSPPRAASRPAGYAKRSPHRAVGL